MKNCGVIMALGFVSLSLAARLEASSGTDAASFLDIPVGARPAAMGSAYSALADDAYAPTWNPAGLGLVDSIQIAAQELAYVQSTSYEYFSVAVPFSKPQDCTNDFWCGRSGVGGSIQYFGSGDITGLDANGNPTGDYSTHYAAYNLSYGRAFGDKLSLGATGKLVNAEIADVSANAFGMDLGSYYQLTPKAQLAATLMNVGTNLTFLNEGDPLPLAFHMAGAYQVLPDWKTTLEVVFPRTGLVSLGMGAEWVPLPAIALRMGYRTDDLSGLSPIAGFSAGMGVNFWNCELAYAWVPYGDLGDSQYFSLLVRFGEGAVESKRNLIQYHHLKTQTQPAAQQNYREEQEPQNLMEMLNEDNLPPAPDANPK